jgi:hypothetical protein
MMSLLSFLCGVRKIDAASDWTKSAPLMEWAKDLLKDAPVASDVHISNTIALGLKKKRPGEDLPVTKVDESSQG